MDENKCPRCNQGIPSDENEGQYPGAISRTDNETEVCSSCGTFEGLEAWCGTLTPKREWFRVTGEVPPRKFDLNEGVELAVDKAIATIEGATQKGI